MFRLNEIDPLSVARWMWREDSDRDSEMIDLVLLSEHIDFLKLLSVLAYHPKSSFIPWCFSMNRLIVGQKKDFIVIYWYSPEETVTVGYHMNGKTEPFEIFSGAASEAQVVVSRFLELFVSRHKRLAKNGLGRQ